MNLICRNAEVSACTESRGLRPWQCVYREKQTQAGKIYPLDRQCPDKGICSERIYFPKLPWVSATVDGCSTFFTEFSRYWFSLAR